MNLWVYPLPLPPKGSPLKIWGRLFKKVRSPPGFSVLCWMLVFLMYAPCCSLVLLIRNLGSSIRGRLTGLTFSIMIITTKSIFHMLYSIKSNILDSVKSRDPGGPRAEPRGSPRGTPGEHSKIEGGYQRGIPRGQPNNGLQIELRPPGYNGQAVTLKFLCVKSARNPD